MNKERAEQVIGTATKVVADYALEVGILRAALESIEAGLANTRSTPGEWFTQIRKQDAWRIAFNALAEVDARRAISKEVAALAGDPRANDPRDLDM